MHQISIKFFKTNIKKAFLWIAFLCGIGTLLFFSGSNFSASVFNLQSNQTSQNSNNDLKIPYYSVEKGESGSVEIIAQKNLGNLAGFSFSLIFPEQKVSADDISTLGTVLEDKGFFVQKNTTESGKISVVGATGGSGVDIHSGDVLLKVAFTLKNDVPLGSEIEINAEKFSIVSAQLSEKNISLSSGKLSVLQNAKSTLSLESLNAFSTGTLEINFSEEIKKASLSDFSFIPSSIKTDQTLINIDNKKVTLSGLNMQAGSPYTIVIAPSIEGNGNKKLSGSVIANFIPEYGDNDFKILSVESISPSHFTLMLSQEVQDDDLKALSVQVKKVINPQNITVYSVEKDTVNTKIIHIYTGTQIEGEKYQVLLNPSLWSNTSNQKLGGKNSVLFTTKENQEVEISRVEPSRFTKGSVNEIHILGRNFSQKSSAKTNNRTLSITSISQNGEEMVVTIPNDISIGSKNITISVGDKNYTRENLFIVEDIIQTISIINEKSYSSPPRVQNDNSTEYSLFALIDNPYGLSNIEKVTVDLRAFGGNAEERMEAGEIVGDQQYFFLSGLTMPETVSTQKEAYLIPVHAKSTVGPIGEGSISLMVTNDVSGSIPPEVRKFSASQYTVAPGNTGTPLIFSAEISDADGNDNIEKVALDLSAVGMGVEFMESKNSGNDESRTWFFEKKDIVIPASVPDGKYTIPLTVIDKTGEEVKKTLELTVARNTTTKPIIDKSQSYISPNAELINDGKSPFKIHIKVNNASGSNAIKSVSANLSEVGLDPISLQEGIEEGRGKWFSSSPLILPDHIDYGSKKIVITATDTDGNFDTQEISLTIVEKTSLGFAPKVISTKGYSTPATSIPDGKSPFSAYVFIEDKDNDISHVILQLSNYAKFIGENLPSENLPDGKTCLSTRTLLCLKPILKEADGQWFYINNIVVPTGVAAGSEPYNLNVIAVDTTGKVGKGVFQMYVGDSVSQELREKPYFRFLTKLSPYKIQMVLSAPLSPENITPENFTISSAEDREETLFIQNILVSPDGKIVTLETEEQIPEKSYVIQLESEALGVRSEKQSDRVINFSGYTPPKSTHSLRVTNAKSTSPNTFVLTFNQEVNALSVRNTKTIEIFQLETNHKLSIEALDFLTPSKLQIRTSEQTPGKRYEIFYTNFESITGEKITNKERKIADGFHISLAESLAELHNRADFNADSKVDFKDFTMFASVYGKSYDSLSQAGDFNNDKNVDFTDFTLMSSQYNQTAPVSNGSTILSPANASTNTFSQ